jgi:undecaprenyl diphosphate synthase
MRRPDLITGNELKIPAPGQVPRRDKLPAHVAIIMDGNGRWAEARGVSRIAGHREGGEAARRTVEAAARVGLECLTLFAFSTENWKRSRFEIRALMDLLVDYLRRELPTLKQNNIQFRMIGDPTALNISVLEQVRRAEIATFQNSGLKLTIALNYGARAEMVYAVRKLAAAAVEGKLQPMEIDESLISRSLFTRLLPDPDLIIRTSGEMRLSNFLLWQGAYSELYVTDRLWPDFTEDDLLQAVATYETRERRFGGLAPDRSGN